MTSKILKISLIALISFSMNLFSKTLTLEQFFDKYSDIDGITYVALNAGPNLLSEFSVTKKLKDQSITNLLKGINKIRILTSKNNQKGETINIYSDAKSFLNLKNFETFLEVKDKGTKVKILYKSAKNKNKIMNFLMLVKEENESTIIWIDGIIDFRSLSKLTGLMGSGFGTFDTTTK